MKCDVPLKNITYVSSFATAVTVTMVAKTTTFISNAKTNYKTVHLEAT